MRLVAPAVALLLIMSGCGAATPSSGNEPTTIHLRPSDVTTKIVGASPAQKEILLQALSGVGDRRIETITIEEPEPGWEGDVALRFSPRAEAVDEMRTSWEAWLVANAFAVRSRELGLQSVAYVALPGEASAIGEATHEMAGRGTAAKVKAFVRRLEVESKRADANVQQIEVLHPLDYAVAATLQVSDPAEFLERRAPRLFERLGEPPGDFDLRFVDSKGAGVSENWHAASGGAVWVRKDLDGCSPYLVSRPIGYTPPPCPADGPASRQSPSRQ